MAKLAARSGHRETRDGRRLAPPGLRLIWTWKSRHRAGRPTVSAEIKSLIHTMSETNPLWGAPRVHGELLKLGINVSQTTVATHMRCHSPPPSQTWRTFLANHVTQLMAADFFVVRKIVPFATPVSRDVERTEQPSTSAEMTAICLAVAESISWMDLSYYTALACQAQSDRSTNESYAADVFFFPQRARAACLAI